MMVNADFATRVVLKPDEIEWVPSPMAGVDRKMLDRLGGEVARATSIVRYAPNSSFSAHSHGGGEEFLVLEGVFSDEKGDYPAGTYVRNPIGSRHVPRSAEGCTIFVKLHQFDPRDSDHVVIDTRKAHFAPSSAPGVAESVLHRFESENVRLIRFAPGARAKHHRHGGGEEILVVEGTLQDQNGDYPTGTWIRNPDGSEHQPFSTEGCLVYVKGGHLRLRP